MSIMSPIKERGRQSSIITTKYLLGKQPMRTLPVVLVLRIYNFKGDVSSALPLKTFRIKYLEERIYNETFLITHPKIQVLY